MDVDRQMDKLTDKKKEKYKQDRCDSTEKDRWTKRETHFNENTVITQIAGTSYRGIFKTPAPRLTKMILIV